MTEIFIFREFWKLSSFFENTILSALNKSSAPAVSFFVDNIVVIYQFFCLGICHSLCADGNGRYGMLPAHPEAALGGIPEQILQRPRLQVLALLLCPMSPNIIPKRKGKVTQAK